MNEWRTWCFLLLLAVPVTHPLSNPADTPVSHPPSAAEPGFVEPDVPEPDAVGSDSLEADPQHVHEASKELDLSELDDEREIMEIAYMAIRGPEQAIKQWGPTADYLTDQIPEYRFVLKPMDFLSFREAMAKDEVNFVLTNPGMYVEFEALYGVRRIATLKNSLLGQPVTEFGSAIFKRADRRDLQGIPDLKDKRFATVDLSAFGGWQMAWLQMLELGFDPEKELSKLYEVGTHDKVVYEVLARRADAGNVRSDTLERMAAEGKIRLDDFALVHRNAQDSDRYPFLLSTRLYPEWPFAILPSTPQELGERVAMALINLPADSEAARAGGYVGWTVPGNYQIVHDALRALRIPPYEHYGEFTWQAAVQKYWHVVASALLSLLVMSVALIWFKQLTSRLRDIQHRLRDELAERQRAQQSLSLARDALQDKNQQLETTNRELADRLEEIKRMQQQIIVQEKMASLGTLTAGIAHEIKNPLNFIVNFSDLSRELSDELSEEISTLGQTLNDSDRGLLEELIGDLKSNAEKINHHGKRADSIVRNMLDHSRGQRGERRKTDINGLLDEYVALAYHGMRATDPGFNVTIERDYDPQVGELTVVSQDLSRVFLNMLNNALYALKERQRQAGPDYTPILTATTLKSADHVEIRIRDNATGIPADQIEKVFQPFFTTKPTGSGTGLGLSISYEIVTQGHGGHMDVRSQVGEFTEFIIELPLDHPINPAMEPNRQDSAR